MGDYFGQTSQFQPAVIFDGREYYHMLFVSQDSSNRLLWITSKDGQNWDGPFHDTGQTTHSAPAIALYPAVDGNPNLLVAILIANDSSNRILYSTLDLDEYYRTLSGNKTQAGWVSQPQVGTESAHAIYAWSVPGLSPQVNLYYLANDNTSRLLQQSFNPVTGETFE